MGKKQVDVGALFVRAAKLGLVLTIQGLPGKSAPSAIKINIITPAGEVIRMSKGRFELEIRHMAEYLSQDVEPHDTIAEQPNGGLSHEEPAGARHP